MYNHTIYVAFNGRIYQTSVIANKDQSDEEVYKIAQEQVIKQWADSTM